MPNVTTDPAPYNPKIEFFKARCDARAACWSRDELSLYDAVDILQAWAAEYLIGDDISQDQIQQIISTAFEQRRSKP